MKLKLRAKDIITGEYVTVSLLETNIKHFPQDGVTYFEDLSGCYDPIPVDTATIEFVKDNKA